MELQKSLQCGYAASLNNMCLETTQFHQWQSFRQNLKNTGFESVFPDFETFAGLLPKCSGFIPCWSPSFCVVSQKLASDSMRNANRSKMP